MTNTELMNLSITELRDLNHKVVEMIKLKHPKASRLNADSIAVGMTVGIKTNNPLLIGHIFLLEKINKKYTVCRDISGLEEVCLAIRSNLALHFKGTFLSSPCCRNVFFKISEGKSLN